MHLSSSPLKRTKECRLGAVYLQLKYAASQRTLSAHWKNQSRNLHQEGWFVEQASHQQSNGTRWRQSTPTHRPDPAWWLESCKHVTIQNKMKTIHNQLSPFILELFTLILWSWVQDRTSFHPSSLPMKNSPSREYHLTCSISPGSKVILPSRIDSGTWRQSLMKLVTQHQEQQHLHFQCPFGSELHFQSQYHQW